MKPAFVPRGNRRRRVTTKSDLYGAMHFISKVANDEWRDPYLILCCARGEQEG